MKTVQRYFWGILFVTLTFGVILELIALFPVFGEDWGIYKWFFAGFIGYLMLMGISNAIFNQNLKFLRTFIHELTHTIFTFLSLKRVQHFQASSHRGGEIHVVGGGNMLILLSPYCIPIFTILLLLLKPLFQLKFSPYMEFLIGFTYFFHLHTNWLQTSNRQTDINKYPFFTSYSFILLFHLLFLGILFYSFKIGLDSFWILPRESIEKLWFFIQHFWNHPIG